MNQKFWQFKNTTSTKADLYLYGDISNESWWEDNVTPQKFAKDLAELGNVDEIAVHINSGGGDVFAAHAIGNQLKQHSATVTAYIDGLCASAATIIACQCDKVMAAEDTVYMIHPISMLVNGYREAVELQKYLDALTAMRENILTLYTKKTGREKEEIASWMDATSWWTAQQAKENGFVDEILTDGVETVVENRSGFLFVNAVGTKVPYDKAPDFLRRKEGKTATPSAKGSSDGIQTVEALRAAYPMLVDRIEQLARNAGREQERERIKSIEKLTLTGSEELAQRAKFQDIMAAETFATALVEHAKHQGVSYLESMEHQAQESGVNAVGSAAPADRNKEASEVANAKAAAAIYLEGKRKGGR